MLAGSDPGGCCEGGERERLGLFVEADQGQGQGQRTLSRLCVEDFEEDVEVPAASAALHGETVAVGMLF